MELCNVTVHFRDCLRQKPELAVERSSAVYIASVHEERSAKRGDTLVLPAPQTLIRSLPSPPILSDTIR